MNIMSKFFKLYKETTEAYNEAWYQCYVKPVEEIIFFNNKPCSPVWRSTRKGTAQEGMTIMQKEITLKNGKDGKVTLPLERCYKYILNENPKKYVIIGRKTSNDKLIENFVSYKKFIKAECRLVAY